MVERISNFLKKLIEGYLDYAYGFCYQQHQLLILIYQITLFCSGIQEVSLVYDGFKNCDLKQYLINLRVLYLQIKQTIITTHIVSFASEEVLLGLLTTHVIINIVIFIGLWSQKKQKLNYLIYILIIFQRNLLFIPTLQTIFYMFSRHDNVQIYVVSLLNLVMYLQTVITSYTWKQTYLLDYNGLIYENKFSVELLYHLILLLAVGVSEISQIGSYLLLILKYFIKLYSNLKTCNYNSQCLAYFYIVSIIGVTSVQFSISMIYFLLIIMFTLTLTKQIQRTFFCQTLFQQELTFYKCQIYELLLNTQSISQLQKIQALILSINCKINRLSSTHLEMLLQQLLEKNNFTENRLIQISCNYNSYKSPHKSIINFIKHFRKTNIYDKAYFSVMISKLNFMIKVNQQLKCLHLAKINIMENDTLIQASKISEQTLILLDKSVLCKIALLENLRKGFQTQVSINILVDQYTESILILKNFIFKHYDTYNYKIKVVENEDVLSLRILQMFFGIIMNDFKQVINLHIQSKTIEKQLDDLLQQDKLFQDTTINNFILLSNQYLILQTSLTNSRGTLVNLNRVQIQQFFNCSPDILQNYQFIQEFMPDFIAELHDELLDQFIVSGFSPLMKISKLTFIQDPENYILPVNLHLYNPFSFDDFSLFAVMTQQSQQQEHIIFDTDGKIQGITRRFFEFTKSSRLNGRDVEISDIIERGSIMCYISSISITMLELKRSIANSINQINNIKSYWKYPDNHTECLAKMMSFMTGSQKTVKNLDNQILGYNVKLLDANYQSHLKNVLSKKQNGFVENSIELTHSLQPYIINNHLFFLISIRDYKLFDSTKTFTTDSNQQQKSLDGITFSTKFTNLDFLMSENQITEQQGIIQDIKSFCTSHHFQIVEKLFKEEDMSGRFVVDISQKNMLNSSQSKLPFLSSRISNRKTLLTGMSSMRQIQPQFQLPQIRSIKQIEESQLDDIEEEMKQLEIMDSIRKYETFHHDQTLQLQQLQQNQLVCQDSNENDNSIKISEKLNESQVNVLLKVQQQQGSQLQMIQEIVNFSDTYKIVKYSLILNTLLTIWVFSMLFINSFLVNTEILTHFQQLQDSIPFQSLQFYVGVPYAILWTLYLNDIDKLQLSPALIENTENKFTFLYGYSSMQQLPFMQTTCSYPNYFDNYFNNTNDCQVYFIRFQSAIMDPFKQYVLDKTLNYDIFKDTFHRVEYFRGQKILLDLLTNYISANASINLNDIFIILLILNFIAVTAIYLLQFQMVKQKQQIQVKLLEVMTRLTYEEVVDLIARFSCFRESWNQNGWKLVNYYDLVNYDYVVKEKQIVKTQKKYMQLDESQYNRKKHIVQIVLITFSFICWVGLFLIGFLIFYVLYQDFSPSFNIAQNFVALKQKLDVSLCYGFGIKTEPLVGHKRNISEQKEIIDLFFNLTGELQYLLDSISQELVASSYLNNQQKQIILDTLNKDLCPTYQYEFCYPDKLAKLPYSETESYQTILSGGITGFIAQIYKFSVSEFEVERNTRAFSTDLDLLQKQIQEQTFKNIFIQYIQDIQFTMYTLFSDFNDGNAFAGNTLLSYINSYYFGFGIRQQQIIIYFSVIILYNLIDLLRIRQSTQDLNQLKLILLILPEQKIENQIIKQKIVEIASYFF